MKNPYPENIIDECTGQEFEDCRHKAYNEGCRDMAAAILKGFTACANDRIADLESIPYYISSPRILGEIDAYQSAE